MIKKIFFGAVFFLLVLIFWQWDLVTYGLGQGIGQLKIVWQAKPLKNFLDAPDFPDSLKQKLYLIEEVRRYAIDSLGLKDTENYKTLYDQKGQEIMWVVQGCEPFALKPKLWDFPIIGSVPYKGFFKKDKAKKEYDRLVKEGYDASIRNPGGWSTLGWFKDPILSGMLKRDEGDLASLIIHEMVHATIFVKDDVDFNENLASFIGDTTSYYFLAAKYGKSSKEFNKYLQEDQDYRKYSRHILSGTKSLDSLYNSFAPDESLEAKKEKKADMIYKIMLAADTLSLFSPRGPITKDRLPNNTYFMSFHLYQSKQSVFKDELGMKFGGDIKKYINHLSEKYPYL
jgi:predicted aminopeptidase